MREDACDPIDYSTAAFLITANDQLRKLVREDAPRPIEEMPSKFALGIWDETSAHYGLDAGLADGEHHSSYVEVEEAPLKRFDTVSDQETEPRRDRHVDVRMPVSSSLAYGSL